MADASSSPLAGLSTATEDPQPSSSHPRTPPPALSIPDAGSVADPKMLFSPGVDTPGHRLPVSPHVHGAAHHVPPRMHAPPSEEGWEGRDCPHRLTPACAGGRGATSNTGAVWLLRLPRRTKKMTQHAKALSQILPQMFLSFCFFCVWIQAIPAW
jgi:hypothetical protein